VPIIHDEQGYAKTPEDAVAAVLKAGKGKHKNVCGLFPIISLMH